MDDLCSELGDFDPLAPLPAAPRPWDYLPMPALRDGPPWAMAEMIAAEPALAARIVDRLAADGSASALATAIREAAIAGAPVIVTGCGTSEHAAQGAAEILRDAWHAAGMPGAGPVAAQAFELAQDPPSNGLVIGISHEGATAATIAAMVAARASGARVALVTASAAAPAAAHADIVLATLELDRSWCHTVGYVSPLLGAATAADLLAGREPNGPALAARIATGIDAAFATDRRGARPAGAIAERIAFSQRILVLGSGVDRVAARELVLKIEEAAWLPSAMRDLETFLHGHLPATGADTGLVVMLTEPTGRAARIRRARQALHASAVLGLGAAGIFTPEVAAAIHGDLTPAGRIVVPEAPLLPRAAASLLGTAAPLQLLTLAIAAARGTNPDPIRRDDPRYLQAAEIADAPEG